MFLSFAALCAFQWLCLQDERHVHIQHQHQEQLVYLLLALPFKGSISLALPIMAEFLCYDKKELGLKKLFSQEIVITIIKTIISLELTWMFVRWKLIIILLSHRLWLPS